MNQRKFSNFLLLISPLVILLCYLLVIGLWPRAERGHAKASPDGKYNLSISRFVDAKPTEPYKVELSKADTEEVIRLIHFFPAGKGNEDRISDQSDFIKWDLESQFVEIQFEGKPSCRIYVD